MLTLDHLHFSYGNHPIVADWSGHIGAGVTLLRGGDGAGKTTRLHLLSGALAAQSGRLCLGRVWLHEDPKAYCRQVFWVDPRSEAHAAATDPLTTLAYADTLRQRFPAFSEAVWESAVTGLRLDEQMGKPIYMLSTGSKRKLWLAGAFASGAPLALLDAPFAALDSRSIAGVTAILQSAAQQTERAFVVADYEAPSGVALAGVVEVF